MRQTHNCAACNYGLHPDSSHSTHWIRTSVGVLVFPTLPVAEGQWIRMHMTLHPHDKAKNIAHYTFLSSTFAAATSHHTSSTFNMANIRYSSKAYNLSHLLHARLHLHKESNKRQQGCIYFPNYPKLPFPMRYSKLSTNFACCAEINYHSSLQEFITFLLFPFFFKNNIKNFN